MTNVFSVIGQHRDEPDRLLLWGDDGRFYAWTTDLPEPIEIEPSPDWTIDEAMATGIPGIVL
jgi:hypothetical protein